LRTDAELPSGFRRQGLARQWLVNDILAKTCGKVERRTMFCAISIDTGRVVAHDEIFGKNIA
jgi:hypothetical protein